jgi:hypothetical protein
MTRGSERTSSGRLIGRRLGRPPLSLTLVNERAIMQARGSGERFLLRLRAWRSFPLGPRRSPRKSTWVEVLTESGCVSMMSASGELRRLRLSLPPPAKRGIWGEMLFRASGGPRDHDVRLREGTLDGPDQSRAMASSDRAAPAASGPRSAATSSTHCERRRVFFRREPRRGSSRLPARNRCTGDAERR